MKAIIPAAGYATRLWPLTKATPKPLLPVKGKPIIEHVIKKILELPIKEISIVTNAKFYPEFQKWKRTFKCKAKIRIISDGTSTNETRLGQIGDIEFVIKEHKINDDILVVAGDNLFHFDLKKANEVFKKRKSVVNVLFDCKSKDTAKELGTVVTDKNGKFLEFMEKAPKPKTTLVSAGIYFLPKDKISRFNQYLSDGGSADKMGYFLAWLLKLEAVYGITFSDQWFDIGWKESLDKARSEYKKK